MTSIFYASGWALLPPLLAIILTLITKEVYSSLFVGILAGGLMYANFNMGKAFVNIFHDALKPRVDFLKAPRDVGAVL